MVGKYCMAKGHIVGNSTTTFFLATPRKATFILKWTSQDRKKEDNTRDSPNFIKGSHGLRLAHLLLLVFGAPVPYARFYLFEGEIAGRRFHVA